MKNKLRKTVLSQLTSQEPETKAEIDKNLLEKLIALPAYKDAQVIATYLAFPHEYDTSLLIKQALKDGKRLLIPKTYKQGQMIFVDYDPDNLVATSFGLMEPASMLKAIVLVTEQVTMIAICLILRGRQLARFIPVRKWILSHIAMTSPLGRLLHASK